MGIYTVQAGDTLTKIAKNFRGDSNAWRDIAASNKLANPNALKIGQQLDIEGYTPPEDMPLPNTNPRREFAQSRGNAFGPAPVAAEPMTAMGPSARAMGAEETAIPEDPTFADLTSEMADRFGDIQTGGTSAEDQAFAADNQPEPPPDDGRGLLVRGQPPLTEQAGPDFSQAEPGATFDPPTQAKIAAMMRVFEQDPTMVDKMIQLMWGDSASAGNVTPE